MSFLVEIEGVELEFDVYGEDRAATWEDPAEHVDVNLIAGELPEGVTLADATELVLAQLEETAGEDEAESRMAEAEYEEAYGGW